VVQRAAVANDPASAPSGLAGSSVAKCSGPFGAGAPGAEGTVVGVVGAGNVGAGDAVTVVGGGAGNVGAVVGDGALVVGVVLPGDVVGDVPGGAGAPS
jgi:hypothetical protein